MECFIVGGWVRDRLLGLSPKDRDWVVVGATAAQMAQQGFISQDSTFPVYLHPDSGEEYALARTETKVGCGHKGFHIVAGPAISLEEDLVRRDLTINAIAQRATGELVDPFDGCNDLSNRVLRHVSPAFVEDPLRLLRVARFSARFAHLGFTLSQETEEILGEMVAKKELSSLSGPRILTETHKALREATPSAFFRVLQQCGAVAQVFPELGDITEVMRYLDETATQKRPDLLFALLAQSVVGKDMEAHLAGIRGLCARLGVAVGERELALSFAAFSLRWQHWDRRDAEFAMTLFRSQDAFRKPDRFLALLELVSICARDDAQGVSVAALRQALPKMMSIRSDALMDLGLQGKAIGVALQKKRQEVLASILLETK